MIARPWGAHRLRNACTSLAVIRLFLGLSGGYAYRYRNKLRNTCGLEGPHGLALLTW